MQVSQVFNLLMSFHKLNVFRCFCFFFGGGAYVKYRSKFLDQKLVTIRVRFRSGGDKLPKYLGL